jgi:DNA-binding CsgD family transcriptional regulator
MSLPEASASRVLDRATLRHQKTLELFHVIIDRLENEPQISTAGSNGHSEQIVLDVEGSRARYLLVRLPKSQSLPVLSPREQEIVRMVAQGHPNKVIAGVLNISCWTVGTHLRRVFSKLGVTSRAAMIARLIEQHSLADTGLLSDARSSKPQKVMVSIEDQPIMKKPSTASAVHCLVELGKRQ